MARWMGFVKIPGLQVQHTHIVEGMVLMCCKLSEAKRRLSRMMKCVMAWMKVSN